PFLFIAQLKIIIIIFFGKNYDFHFIGIKIVWQVDYYLTVLNFYCLFKDFHNAVFYFKNTENLGQSSVFNLFCSNSSDKRFSIIGTINVLTGLCFTKGKHSNSCFLLSFLLGWYFVANYFIEPLSINCCSFSPLSFFFF